MAKKHSVLNAPSSDPTGSAQAIEIAPPPPDDLPRAGLADGTQVAESDPVPAEEQPPAVTLDDLLGKSKAAKLHQALDEDDNRARALKRYCQILLDPRLAVPGELGELIIDLKLTEQGVKLDAELFQRFLRLRASIADEAAARNELREALDAKEATRKAAEAAALRVFRLRGRLGALLQERGDMTELVNRSREFFIVGAGGIPAARLIGEV